MSSELRALSRKALARSLPRSWCAQQRTEGNLESLAETLEGPSSEHVGHALFTRDLLQIWSSINKWNWVNINITHSLDSSLLIQPARSPVQATKCPRHSSALSFTWRDSTFQKPRSRFFLWKRCGRCGLLINVSGKKLCFEHLRACKVQPAENEVASCKCYVSIPHFGPNLEDRYHLLELSASLLRNWPPNVKP